MGFRFRRTFKIVPGVRLNLSGSGASVSFGPRGLRYTVGPRGTRTTVGLPGSGLSWTAYQPYANTDRAQSPDQPRRYEDAEKPLEPISVDPSATIIDSAPIEQLIANSTIDIAGALKASQLRWHSYKMWLALLSAIFVLAALVLFGSAASIPPVVAFLLVAGAIVILGSTWLHGRETSTISLDYDLSEEELGRFDALARAFDALSRANNLWGIPLEKQEADWKRNAGAAKIVERTSISLARGNPSLVRSNVQFLQLPLGKETVYLTPDAVLVMSGDDVAGFGYADVRIECRQARFIEDSIPPNDAVVVGETWQYLNRKGGPDRRFKNNRQLPICLYGEIDIKSAGGLNERIQCSRVDVCEQFASAVAAMPTMIANNYTMPSKLLSIQQDKPVQQFSDLGTIYAHETDRARSLALNHGEYWEFLLVEELLKSRLDLLKADCQKLANIVPRKIYTGREFVNWVGDESTGLSIAVADMASCIQKDLMSALGKPGESGDALAMLSAVDAIFVNCRKFLQFEQALNVAEVSSAFHALKVSFRGITLGIVRMMDDLTTQWSQKTEAVKNGAQKFELMVNFETPPQALKALKEIDKISKKPHLF